MPRALLALAFPLIVCSCAAPSASVAGKSEGPIPGPAGWQGQLADRMNQDATAPVTPALRGLVGQAPLVYVARIPARGVPDEPAYELAVFDDGTFVYEGHRCVEVGGLAITHVAPDGLTDLRDLLAKHCTDLDGATNEDQLCAEPATLRVACSNGERLQSGSDHCRKRDDAAGQHIDALVTALGERLGLDSWVGEPTRRQACTVGARDLAPHELMRTVRSDLADAGHSRP